ncbi:glycohydrolase toxin TNT-related protein [Streptomyces sp. NPDC059851]|uniref:TNT domain-containing protein n=1 Tax=Streptomyces sp. NPDC059851 TaxID=3346971 RepID=UPI003648150E
MAFPRWCASLATTAGLTGSVLLGALPAGAVEAQAATVSRFPVPAEAVPPPAPGRASDGEENKKREEGRKHRKEKGKDKEKGKGKGKGEDGKKGKEGKEEDKEKAKAKEKASRPGSQGQTGAKGKTGSDGKTGANGKTRLEGKTGSDGKTGADGKTGSDGKTGADGKTRPEDKTGSEAEKGPDTKGTSDAEKARCLGLVPSPYPYAHTEFKCNDWRFGPAKLPKNGVLGAVLSDYQRFGGLTPVEFLNKWWDPTADNGLGSYAYPNSDGFARDANGQVIATELTLRPGQLLDRFGAEFGSFLAPAGTKYGARSIPPTNLNTQDPRYPFDYHLYRVKKPTLVCAGPTLPWFEQPGEGVQYVTTVRPGQGDSYCPHVQTGTRVSDLVRSGNLERAN